MNYQNYIDLGFKRTDLNDTVEFKETGYYGYCLEKRINARMLVSLSSGELDKPKLYIQKTGQECYHIIQITPEMVMDIFNAEKV